MVLVSREDKCKKGTLGGGSILREQERGRTGKLNFERAYDLSLVKHHAIILLWASYFI